MISKQTITEANGGSMPTVVRSSISHQKLVSPFGLLAFGFLKADHNMSHCRIKMRDSEYGYVSFKTPSRPGSVRC